MYCPYTYNSAHQETAFAAQRHRSHLRLGQQIVCSCRLPEMLVEHMHLWVLLLPTVDLIHLAHTCRAVANVACSEMYYQVYLFHVCLRCNTLAIVDADHCNWCRDPMIWLDGGLPGLEKRRIKTTTFEYSYTQNWVMWNNARGPWRPHRLGLIVRFWCHIEEIWGTQGHLLDMHWLPAIRMTLKDDPSALNPVPQPQCLEAHEEDGLSDASNNFSEQEDATR